MIVFDLKCRQGHVFEAWFGSSAAYESQRDAAQVRCPFCDDHAVSKALMAPAIASKGNTKPDAASRLSLDSAKSAIKAMVAMQAEALKTSQWVGQDFSLRARAMHHGEETPTAIHGQASMSEARALIEEGVSVAPLLVPVVPPNKVN